MATLKVLSEIFHKSCLGRNESKTKRSKEEKPSSKLPYQPEPIKFQLLNSRLLLNFHGSDASIRRSFAERVPLFLTDVQEFLIYSLLDPDKFYYFTCKWIDILERKKLSKLFVLIVDGVTLCDYINFQYRFTNIINGFKHSCVEVLSDGNANDSVIETMSVIPLVQVEKYDLCKAHGCMEVSLNQLNDHNAMIKYIFPVLEADNEKEYYKSATKYDRTSLLLSPSKMLSEKYPLPVPGKLGYKYAEYFLTKDFYHPVTDSSPMFGLDCERCDTEGGSEMFRVSIVDEKNYVVYNTYVLPQCAIIGNRQRFSGITKEQLLNVTTKIYDVQKHIKNILPPDAILIGQSLNYDMHALKMMHPYVINTSCAYNSSGSRRRKSKLKDFTWQYLDREIQQRGRGHCSVEDAEAAIDLVQLKLSKSPQYGDVILEKHKEDHKLDKDDSKDSHNKPVIIGKNEIINEYLRHIAKKSCSKINYSKAMDLIPCDDLGGVALQAAKFTKQRKLTFSHIDLTRIDDSGLMELDKLVGAIWRVSTHETLITIFLTGSHKCNGALFYNIKE